MKKNLLFAESYRLVLLISQFRRCHSAVFLFHHIFSCLIRNWTQSASPSHSHTAAVYSFSPRDDLVKRGSRFTVSFLPVSISRPVTFLEYHNPPIRRQLQFFFSERFVIQHFSFCSSFIYDIYNFFFFFNRTFLLNSSYFNTVPSPNISVQNKPTNVFRKKETPVRPRITEFIHTHL